MICFSGEISNISKRFLVKTETKSSIVIIIVCLIVSVPLIIASFVEDWIYAIGIIPLILMCIISFIPPKGKVLDTIFPRKICIINEIITLECLNYKTYRKISNVKKVLDYGDWYQIIFKFPHKSFRFLCQKNLITEGTIEDFETLFKGKIVRKKYKLKDKE